MIPTNKPIVRKDQPDLVYKNEAGKFRAVVGDIEDCHKRGQPVLVGTVSVEKSEVVANLLKQKGLPFNVLNAKQHQREASIVAQAGRKGAITIATNMAGRGTDILLGGNPEAMAKDALQEEKDKLAAEAAVRRAERCRRDRRSVPRLEPARVRRGQALPGAAREVQGRVRGRARGGARRRRAQDRRHRAPRVAPHRQPAPRSRRSPGRSGLVAVLPVAAGRPAADLRPRSHGRPDGAARPRGGRPDRVADGDAVDRERAEEGRGSQLRPAQERPRVRRRHEPAAQDDLRAAPPGPRRPLPPRADRGRSRRPASSPSR